MTEGIVKTNSVGTSLVKEEPVRAGDDVTSINVKDDFFKTEIEENFMNSSDIKKEQLYDGSSHEDIDVVMKIRPIIQSTSIKEESVETNSVGTSLVKEEKVYVDDDVTSINVMDDFFKVEREGVAINSLENTENSIRSIPQTSNKKSNDDCLMPRHIVTHTGGKPYECDICNTQFTAFCALRKHMRAHAQREKLFTCDICKKNFYEKFELNRHIRIHTGDKPFRCDICTKTFIEKFKLKIHKRTHTGEKPFTCNICKKKFNQNFLLNLHIKTHTGEKLFTCDVCKKKFTEMSFLRRHMIIHTGEKMFECDVCKKKFTQKSSLTRHNVRNTHLKNKRTNLKT